MSMDRSSDRGTDAPRFLIGTEMGVLHQLRSDNPDKEFFLLTPRLVCSNMKLTTPGSVLRALEEKRSVVEVDEPVRRRAAESLERMLRS